LCSIENCDRAVEIALYIIQQVQRHNRRYPLLKLDIKIGVNVGEVLKEDSDYYGSSVNLAARVCDLAGGNEIYATGIVALRCEDEHSYYKFVSHGKHDIKGFSHQIPICEVCIPKV
jgi:adenylate cyclase